VSHPDVCDGDRPAASRWPESSDRQFSGGEIGDAAVDFIDAATFVESIRAAFFA
jgi:hypothetical protein